MERSSFTFDRRKLTNERISEVSMSTVSPESIEALAERVLFSNSLEEKLHPRPLDSGAVGGRAAKIRPEQFLLPARPEELSFERKSGPRPRLPTDANLVNEESRGVLLHFFANHELLAAELMALALLKFPEAPVEFRNGLAKTLREEQRHTRWYMSRMSECGVTFGEYPVNGFFWDAVSGMENPLDYVSRLSLTFEQANLDYSLHYSKILQQCGDTKSASILRKIYEDEIDHVGYGLHWFRQWKDPEQNDWDALKTRLLFPLSPARAKGNRAQFNAAGRSAAGFDDDYIRNLRHFERSKGRTPNVFYFNPEAENRVASYPKPYHPDKRIQSVITDLEIVTAFLARRDDLLLMRRPPSQEHRAKLATLGIVLPEIEALSEDGTLESTSLTRERKLNAVRPWSLAPDLPEVLGCLKENTYDVSAAFEWKKDRAQLYSKSAQLSSLGHWGGLSMTCSDKDSLQLAIRKLLDEGWSKGILKRPFSTAGGGMRRLDLAESLSLEAKEFPDSVTEKGGLILEPAHDRVFDFSVQYEIGENTIKQVGLVQQIIAPSGGYRGSLSQSKFCQGLAPELARFLMNEALPHYNESSEFNQDLLHWFRSLGYQGPAGVDAYIYRDRNGELQTRVVCEINARYTMGRVAHELRTRFSPGLPVKFEIVKAGNEPAEFENRVPQLDSKGRLGEGCFRLNELNDDTIFIAKMTIAKRFQNL